MPHLGGFVPSNYFACIYVPVYNFNDENRPIPQKSFLRFKKRNSCGSLFGSARA